MDEEPEGLFEADGYPIGKYTYTVSAMPVRCPTWLSGMMVGADGWLALLVGLLLVRKTWHGPWKTVVYRCRNFHVPAQRAIVVVTLPSAEAAVEHAKLLAEELAVGRIPAAGHMAGLGRRPSVGTEGLTYAQIVDVAVSEAERYGLELASRERDKTLFVTISRTSPAASSPERAVVSFWTSGSEAYLTDFDDQWTWVGTAYTSADQAETVRDIVRLAAAYLGGEGQEVSLKSRWGRERRQLVFEVSGEPFRLQENRERRRRRRT